MEYNEILDYDGKLIILTADTSEIKPIFTCHVNKLRHQESILLEDYMDTVISILGRFC